MICIGIIIGFFLATATFIIIHNARGKKARELIHEYETYTLTRTLAKKMYEFLKEQYYD